MNRYYNNKRKQQTFPISKYLIFTVSLLVILLLYLWQKTENDALRIRIEDLKMKLQPGRHPLFDVVLNMINLNQPLNSPGDLPAEPVENVENEESITNYQTRSKFDLTLYFIEKVKNLTIFFEYKRDLFEPKTINRMARRYRKLLDSITANPAASVSKLLMLEEEIKVPAFGSFISR